MTAFLLLVIAICFSVTGELFLKAGMNQVGVVTMENALVSAQRAATNPRILLGFTGFGLGAIVWLVVLSRAHLSWAYPMLSLGYVLVLFFSVVVLREPVSPVRWIGALVICAGVYLISRS